MAQKRLGDGVIQDKMIVLDASVVVKWFSEEEDTDKALEKRFELCKIHRRYRMNVLIVAAIQTVLFGMLAVVRRE